MSSWLHNLVICRRRRHLRSNFMTGFTYGNPVKRDQVLYLDRPFILRQNQPQTQLTQKFVANACYSLELLSQWANGLATSCPNMPDLALYPNCHCFFWNAKEQSVPVELNGNNFNTFVKKRDSFMMDKFVHDSLRTNSD